MTDMATLFYEARKYGSVGISTFNDGNYFCRIEFATISGTKLEATSDYKQATVEAAIKQALEKAILIISSLDTTRHNLETTKKLLGVN